MGVNVNRTISMTFAIGSGLATVAGVLCACSYGFIGPYMGSMAGIKAFIAAVLGGIGNVPGAMLGGILLGLIESLSKAYISSQLSGRHRVRRADIGLLIRPAGLLGKTRTEESVGERHEKIFNKKSLHSLGCCARLPAYLLLSGQNILSRQYRSLLVPIGVNVILAVSLNLTTGFLGELTLSHARFMAVGAYAGCLVSVSMPGLPLCSTCLSR